MLLYASGSGTQNLNAGTVFYGGNVPSGDRISRAPGLSIVSTGAHYNYINASTGGGLYLASSIVGGSLAADDRDDAIIYLSQKRDLAGVASTKLAQSIAGSNFVFRMPYTTLSGSVLLPSGQNYYGIPAVVGVSGETYGTYDRAASGVGNVIQMQGGKNPISTGYPPR